MKLTPKDVLAELDLYLNPANYRIESPDGSVSFEQQFIKSMTFQELLHYFRPRLKMFNELIGFSNTTREGWYFKRLEGMSHWKINKAMWEYNEAWDTIKQEGEK